MATSRIEQIIEDIYVFVEGCKTATFSQNKVVVPKDELYDLLDELRLRTPDEIKRYQKIIGNRDAIIKDAEEKAIAIIDEAKKNAENMITDNEIMQKAYYRANEMITNASTQAEDIMSSAQHDSDQIRSGALQYANDILAEIERVLSIAYDNTRVHNEQLLQSLKANLDIVVENRRELSGEPEETEAESERGEGFLGDNYEYSPADQSLDDDQTEEDSFKFDDEFFKTDSE